MARYRWLGLAFALVVAGCGSSLGGASSGTGSSDGGAAVPVPGLARASVPRLAPSAPAADAAALADENDAFAGRMLGVLAQGTGNVAFSPFSISSALGMTVLGARGTTASQIDRALSFRLPDERLATAWNALDAAISGLAGPGLRLNVANALFGQRGTAFRPAFLDVLAREFGAGMRTVDFAAPEVARTSINTWVAGQTDEKIPALMPEGSVDPLTRLVLVNALYMKAKWQSQFVRASTSSEVFFAPGGPEPVPTMHQDGTFPYVAGAGYRALELPYVGDRLAFDIVLPSPGGLAALARRVAASGPLALLRGLAPTRVSLALPKLTLRSHSDLRTALTTLGMGVAFAPGQADLSGIAGRPGDLYIKSVQHEVYLHVDETGTEAAAATGVVAEASSAMLVQTRFVVDHPFLFLVRDRGSGAILFMGVVNRP